LYFGRIDDLGWVYVNGVKVGETSDWSRPYSFDVTQELRPGTNLIAVVVWNNQGVGGLGRPSLRQVPARISVRVESWGSPRGLEEDWWDPALDDRRWETVAIGTSPGSVESNALLSWYRLEFKLPVSKRGIWTPWRLRLNATGNGFLYLNGHPLGRYWQAGPQHDFFLPECWLNFGEGQGNNVTLSLRPAGKGAAIQSAVVGPYAEFAEKR
jgi:hypothetical protein